MRLIHVVRYIEVTHFISVPFPSWLVQQKFSFVQATPVIHLLTCLLVAIGNLKFPFELLQLLR